MGKPPPEDTRSRTNSIDKKYVDSKPRDGDHELVDTTAPKEASPSAPLLDRLAEVSEAEARSIHQELSPAQKKRDLIRRQPITPSGLLANINSKENDESPIEKEFTGKTRDAVDERQPYQTNLPEAKRRHSNAESNRQPASTTPPPTWARPPGVSPYHHQACGKSQRPGQLPPPSHSSPAPHKYAYPRAPSTIPPPHHRTSPPLRGPPYYAVHPHHVHHHHHYYPPPSHYGHPHVHYGSRSYYEYPRMFIADHPRHLQHTPPTHPPPHAVAPSAESMPPPLGQNEGTETKPKAKLKPEKEYTSDLDEDDDSNVNKISDTVEKGLPPKKRKLLETTLETCTPTLSAENKNDMGGTNCNTDSTGGLQQHGTKKTKNEGTSSSSAALVESELKETKAIFIEAKRDTNDCNGTERNTANKPHEIVPASPCGVVSDAVYLSKKDHETYRPAAEEQKRDIVESVASTDLVPSNPNSTKSTPSRLTTPSSSVANTPKAEDHKHDKVTSARIYQHPPLSPPPPHYSHHHCWGHPRPPPSHLRHPMSPLYGKHPPAARHHPSSYFDHPPPHYYPPPVYGRPSQEKLHWPHHHRPTFHPPQCTSGYPHHRPVPASRPFPLHVGSDPSITSIDSKPLESPTSPSVATSAKTNDDERRTTLTVETGANESEEFESPSNKNTDNGGIPSLPGSQNKGRCVHVWGSMLMTFISKRGVCRGEDSVDTLENPLPPFHQLVNFPEYLPQKSPANANHSENENKHKSSTNSSIKNCVMCGIRCHFVGSVGSKNLSRGGNDNGSKVVEDITLSATGSEPCLSRAPANTTTSVIPRQNKGLCTSCDVKVWLVRDLNLTIKWCKGCKNFRQWSAFGDKTRATKCAKCRERQKEKYASQKEELKIKRKIIATEGAASSGSDGEDSSKTPPIMQSKLCGDIAAKKEDESSDSLLDAAIGLSKMMNS